jgi:hypothetical protein
MEKLTKITSTNFSPIRLPIRKFSGKKNLQINQSTILGQFDSFRSDLSTMHNPIRKLEQPICSNLSNLTTVRVMNNQQINLAMSNPVI